jgi:hypothetical protein
MSSLLVVPITGLLRAIAWNNPPERTRSMARPTLPIHPRQVRFLAQLGLPVVAIAWFFGCDRGTLYKRFGKQLQMGKAERYPEHVRLAVLQEARVRDGCLVTIHPTTETDPYHWAGRRGPGILR